MVGTSSFFSTNQVGGGNPGTWLFVGQSLPPSFWDPSLKIRFDVGKIAVSSITEQQFELDKSFSGHSSESHIYWRMSWRPRGLYFYFLNAKLYYNWKKKIVKRPRVVFSLASERGPVNLVNVELEASLWEKTSLTNLSSSYYAVHQSPPKTEREKFSVLLRGSSFFCMKSTSSRKNISTLPDAPGGELPLSRTVSSLETGASLFSHPPLLNELYKAVWLVYRGVRGCPLFF